MPQEQPQGLRAIRAANLAAEPSPSPPPPVDLEALAEQVTELLRPVIAAELEQVTARLAEAEAQGLETQLQAQREASEAARQLAEGARDINRAAAQLARNSAVRTATALRWREWVAIAAAAFLVGLMAGHLGTLAMLADRIRSAVTSQP